MLSLCKSLMWRIRFAWNGFWLADFIISTSYYSRSEAHCLLDNWYDFAETIRRYTDEKH